MGEACNEEGTDKTMKINGELKNQCTRCPKLWGETEVHIKPILKLHIITSPQTSHGMIKTVRVPGFQISTKLAGKQALLQSGPGWFQSNLSKIQNATFIGDPPTNIPPRFEFDSMKTVGGVGF